MTSKLSRWLNQHSTPRNMLALFALTLLFGVVIFPLIQAQFAGLPAQAAMLDTRFSYTPAQAHEALDAFGESGRQLYLVSALTADLLFPVIYSLFLAMSLTYLLPRAFPLQSLVQRLHLLPFGMAVFDYLENACVAILLASYPTELNGLARLASSFTTTKWLLGASSIALALYGLARLAVTSWGRKS